MGVELTLNTGRVPVKVWTMDIEHEAMQQLINRFKRFFRLCMARGESCRARRRKDGLSKLETNESAKMV